MLKCLCSCLKIWRWKSRLPNKKVKLFITDIDGVMTDGGMYYAENGDEFKKFQVQDGMGLVILKERGIKTAFVTSESRDLNLRRSKKLNIDFYYPGEKNKIQRVQEMCALLSISLDEVAHIGDDINDLEVLRTVGFKACPANARPEVKAISGIYQTNVSGGSGAVREWIDLLIQSGKV